MKAYVLALAAAVTLAASGARESVDLSGAGWTANGDPVTIPHTWNAIDGADGGDPEWGDSASSLSYARRTVVYRRGLPSLSKNRRAFLRFQGVSSKAVIRVNGHEIGRHVGAYTAFVCEATEWMSAGSGNGLEVVVDNLVDSNVPPCAADFTVYGGIYRGVELIVTDRVCIDPTFHGGPGVWVEADPATGRVAVDVRLNGATENAVVTCEVRDPSGKVVTSGDPKSLLVPHPALWSPVTPNLYTLTAMLKDGMSEDRVSVRFGFRTVEFRKDGFYLNGARHKIRGVNRHQDREGKGWALTAADEDEDIALIKEMGADGLRTAHYPQSVRIYDLCDEKGLLAWVESPNVNALNGSEECRRNAIANLEDAIWQHKNHPSVFVWSISNELSTNRAPQGVTERLMTELKGIAKGIDRTRSVSLATCRAYQKDVNAIPDAIGFNFYPGWYRNVPDGMTGTIDAALADNPFLTTIGVTEYGAGACVLQHGDARARNMPLTPVHIEEWQAWVHYRNYKSLFADDRVWGSFVWVMFDFGADARREGPRHGINDKGLVTGDRRFRKDAFHLYKANWTSTPVLHLVGSRLQQTTNALMTVVGFSNVGAVRLTVNGREIGVKDPDEVKTVVWKDVLLEEGANEIRLESGACSTMAVWTRAAALAEALWSAPVPRDFTVFRPRLEEYRK